MKKQAAIIFLSLSLGTFAQKPFKCGDTLVDIRDGQKYPTVLIGTQCWTARNMNIGEQVQNTSQSNNQKIEKTCYDNKMGNCDSLGGLYTYGEATQYVTSGKSIQGVCPVGWHVASKEEYEQLINSVGKEKASQKLKMTKQDSPKWDGTNESGFSAVPAGLAYYDVFGRKGDWSVFWTGTSVNPDYSWSVEMDNYYQTLSGPTNIKLTDTYLIINAFSVRCIKN